MECNTRTSGAFSRFFDACAQFVYLCWTLGTEHPALRQLKEAGRQLTVSASSLALPAASVGKKSTDRPQLSSEEISGS